MQTLLNSITTERHSTHPLALADDVAASPSRADWTVSRAACVYVAKFLATVQSDWQLCREEVCRAIGNYVIVYAELHHQAEQIGLYAEQ